MSQSSLRKTVHTTLTASATPSIDVSLHRRWTAAPCLCVAELHRCAAFLNRATLVFEGFFVSFETLQEWDLKHLGFKQSSSVINSLRRILLFTQQGTSISSAGVF
ncbi:hypothetical protein VNO78_15331 [Psophocarpus tetragonolobus]|uniref:Uncharacterized protein n=1 Tax=Psophocarpus tetragonolobus TaxID=3891 RepID=A0AAN9SEU0_PSOTE